MIKKKRNINTVGKANKKLKKLLRAREQRKLENKCIHTGNIFS